MRKKLLFIFAFLLAASAANAAVSVNIFANSTIGLYVDSEGDILDSGDLLVYGTFDEAAYDLLTESEQSDYSTVSSLFTVIGSVTADSSGEFLAVGVEVSSSDVDSGDQLYVWVFNSSSADTATEWGIFSSSNTNWDFAADPGVSTLSTATLDNIVVGSVSGDNFALSAVPEPSAYAAIAGLLALSWVMVRRRA
jgi:hypothetical protein